MFPGTNDYITIPLNSLSSQPVIQGLGVYLINPNNTDPYYENTVILGTPFYNSFLTQMALNIANPSANNVTMWVNLYAEYSPYLGNATLNQSSTNPFLYISPVVPTPSKTTKLGLILGIIGGVLGAALIGVGVYFLLKKCRGTVSESDAMATVY